MEAGGEELGGEFFCGVLGGELGGGSGGSGERKHGGRCGHGFRPPAGRGRPQFPSEPLIAVVLGRSPESVIVRI